MLPFDSGVDCGARDRARRNGVDARPMLRRRTRPVDAVPRHHDRSPALTPPTIRSGVWRSVAQRRRPRPSRATRAEAPLGHRPARPARHRGASRRARRRPAARARGAAAPGGGAHGGAGIPRATSRPRRVGGAPRVIGGGATVSRRRAASAKAPRGAVGLARQSREVCDRRVRGGEARRGRSAAAPARGVAAEPVVVGAAAKRVALRERRRRAAKLGGARRARGAELEVLRDRGRVSRRRCTPVAIAPALSRRKCCSRSEVLARAVGERGAGPDVEGHETPLSWPTGNRRLRWRLRRATDTSGVHRLRRSPSRGSAVTVGDCRRRRTCRCRRALRRIDRRGLVGVAAAAAALVHAALGRLGPGEARGARRGGRAAVLAACAPAHGRRRRARARDDQGDLRALRDDLARRVCRSTAGGRAQAAAAAARAGWWPRRARGGARRSRGHAQAARPWRTPRVASALAARRAAHAVEAARSISRLPAFADAMCGPPCTQAASEVSAVATVSTPRRSHSRARARPRRVRRDGGRLIAARTRVVSRQSVGCECGADRSRRRPTCRSATRTWRSTGRPRANLENRVYASHKAISCRCALSTSSSSMRRSTVVAVKYDQWSLGDLIDAINKDAPAGPSTRWAARPFLLKSVRDVETGGLATDASIAAQGPRRVKPGGRGSAARWPPGRSRALLAQVEALTGVTVTASTDKRAPTGRWDARTRRCEGLLRQREDRGVEGRGHGEGEARCRLSERRLCRSE